MADQMPPTEIIEAHVALWRTDRQPAGCTHCRRVYLVMPDQQGTSCPLCQHGTLEAQPARVRPSAPELILPFQINQRALLPAFQKFVAGVWIKPEGFNPEMLLNNARPVFWPLWLVDSDVNGHWGMVAGFDYQVESAKEVYNSSGWESLSQIENRIRWEQRVGELETHVDNVVTPALEEHPNRQKMTGDYPLDRATPFDPDFLGAAFLEVPDLPPEEAWPQARPHVDKALAEICQKAIGAQHFRDFTITAKYNNQNWTELFLPMYTSYYLDDEGQNQIVVINAVTGTIRGPRLASIARASRIAAIMGGVAGLVFLLALIGLLLVMVFPPAAVIAALLGILGLGLGIMAIIIAVWPRQWNRAQSGSHLTNRN